MSTAYIALFVAVATLVSSCAAPTNATQNPSETSKQTAESAAITEKPWWEGRTWAGEIDICVDATGDEPGCQLLAGLLIHRRCELRIYQTFAAALSVGADYQDLHNDAMANGDCKGPSRSERAEDPQDG